MDCVALVPVKSILILKKQVFFYAPSGDAHPLWLL